LGGAKGAEAMDNQNEIPDTEQTTTDTGSAASFHAEASSLGAVPGDMTAPAAATASEAATATQVAQAIAPEVMNLAAPPPGEQLVIQFDPATTYVFDFALADAELVLADGNLNILVAGGGEIIIEGYMEGAALAGVPPLNFAGETIAAFDLATQVATAEQLVELDELAAAGAAAGPAGPLPNTGAGFDPYDPGPQLPGIDDLGPLGPTALGFTAPEPELRVFPEEALNPPRAFPLDVTAQFGEIPFLFDGGVAEFEGFEDGISDFWNTLGSVIVVGSEFGIAPTEGSNQAFLQASGATDAEIEAFFGIPAGTLDALINDDGATDGSALKTTLTVQAGDQITFDFNFLDLEQFDGDPGFLDFAFVVVGDDVIKLADVLGADDGPIVTSIGNVAQTGYDTMTVTFTTSGDVMFGFMNEGDTSVDSGLLIDNISFSGGEVLSGGTLLSNLIAPLNLIALEVVESDTFNIGDDPGAGEVEVGYLFFTVTEDGSTVEISTLTGEADPSFNPTIYVFTDDGSLTLDDKVGEAENPGDELLELTLDAGDYVVAVGAHNLTDDEAVSGTNSPTKSGEVTVTATITEPLPSLSIDDVVVNEGDGTATFTVTLSAASADTVTVDFATADGTAEASSDYTATGDTLTFDPGETTQTIVVPITDDAVDEATTENFFVNLTDPTNATILDGEGEGTIVDNDGPPPPSLSIDDVTVNEADGTATFTVTLSAASAETVTVDFATADGTAEASSDYTATGGTLTFDPGETTQEITVDITDDAVFEPTENFFVNLTSPTNATISDAQGEGTIIDNDLLPVEPVWFFLFDLGGSDDGVSIGGDDPEDGLTTVYTITSLPNDGMLFGDTDGDGTFDTLLSVGDTLVDDGDDLQDDVLYVAFERPESGLDLFQYTTTDSDSLVS
jgi:hypothetical protein